MRHVVARVEDVPPGTMTRVEAAGRAFCLVNLGGRFHALVDRCPHAGAPLSAGRLSGVVESDGPGDYRLCRQGEMVKCPWHGWEFEVATGQSWCDPRRMRARHRPAERVAGRELVRGPHVAERVPVSVEGDYVVIDL
ncbi:MAG: ferredoxin [Paracoccaceae bacterium]|nr:MAG: Rieske (2Fe-2S) protein [Alphaproteobacteria bacterium]GIX15358.1 MAG: ferredoxin [Paracoccaceae bacterium]